MITAAVFSGVVLYMWTRDKLKKKQKFVVGYGVVVTICFSLLAILFPFEKTCRNNANVVDGTDGLTLCAIEGAVLLFMEHFCAICFCLQSYEVFRGFVLSDKTLPNYGLYLNLALGFPLLLAMVCLFVGVIGATFAGDFCRVTGKSAAVVSIAYGPIVLFTLAGLVFCFGILFKLLRLVLSKSVSRNDGLVLAGTSLRYLVFSGCYLLSMLLVAAFSPLFDQDALHSSIDEWAQCALLHFDGSDDDSYSSICGVHATRRMSFTSYAVLTVYFRAGFGLFFMVVNIDGLRILLRKYICITVMPTEFPNPKPLIVENAGVEPPSADGHLIIPKLHTLDPTCPKWVVQYFDGIENQKLSYDYVSNGNVNVPEQSPADCDVEISVLDTPPADGI